PAIGRDLPFVGMVLAGDQAEQCGLARAVRADETDLLAALERRGSFDEDDLVAVLFADVVEADHEAGHGYKFGGAVMPTRRVNGKGGARSFGRKDAACRAA